MAIVKAAIPTFDQFTAAQLEPSRCTVCDGTESKPLFRVHGFPIVRCRRCDLRYVTPRLKPSELFLLYSDPKYFKSNNSLASGYHDYLAERENIHATTRRRLDWIFASRPDHRRGTLLDIGCAFGFSVETALAQGWDAYGIEPSSHAAQGARQNVGDRVTEGTLDSLPLENKRFDLIFLWDVIEHMPDPVRTLQQTAALLAPDGVLSLITPDCGSRLARWMGKRWMEYSKPTEHIYFFNRQTLNLAARRAGLESIAETTAGKFVSFGVLVERLCSHLHVPSRLRTASAGIGSTHSLYIDPGDKMHLLLRKDR